MSMKTKAAVLVTSFAVLLFVVVGSLGGVHASSNDGAYRQLQVYSEVLSRVHGEYVEEPNIPKVTDGALHGLLESLDPNSSYMTADAYKAYKAHKVEAKGEIGATVSKRLATRPWWRFCRDRRPRRPALSRPTSLNRSRARALARCRYLKFAACSPECPAPR
jgi:hypothetical protein